MQKQAKDDTQNLSPRTIVIIGIVLLAAFAIGYLLAGPASEPEEETLPSESTTQATETEPGRASSEEVFPYIAAMRESVSRPENPTLDNMVTTIYDVSAQWETYNGQTASITISLPAITPISSDAISINEQIRTEFSILLHRYRSCYDKYTAPTDVSIGYEAWLSGDALSILITCCSKTGEKAYSVYTLNVATGAKLTNDYFLTECLDISYLEVLYCTTRSFRDYYSATESSIFDIYELEGYTFFLAEDGQLMICQKSKNSVLCPFKQSFSDQLLQDTYSWLFSWPSYRIEAIGSEILTEAFLSNTQTFLDCLSQSQESVITTVGRMLAKAASEEVKTVCLELLEDPSLTDAEAATVKLLLKQISPDDYNAIIQAEMDAAAAVQRAQAIALLSSRTLIFPEEYTCTIVGIKAHDPSGYATQGNVSGVISTTPYSSEYAAEYLEIYDPYYTDELCPESWDSVRSRYDEAFFEDHILLTITVITQNGVLPELNRIYSGAYDSEYSIFNAYVDNVVENPTDPMMYRILIELPRSYWDGESDWFPAYGKNSNTDWLWFWEND